MATNVWYLKTTNLFLIISAVNLLNFIDRGIIPGATNEINSFIQSDLRTSTPDVFLGLLQSSFIIGYMIGSIIFGHMVHSQSKFTLIGIGCTIWIVAVFLSGVSFYTGSYIFLLFARVLSGFGEAGMQCTVPPWIQSDAPVSQRGLWLSLFYTAIPVGTAIGYAFSSLMASTVGWQWAFFLEGFIMIPFVAFVFSIAPLFPCKHVIGLDASKFSFFNEVKAVFGQPLFLLFTAAAAAQAATLIGLSTFGSAFVMGLGFFDNETEASTVFGAIISLSGMVATPLGGYILDKGIKSSVFVVDTKSEDVGVDDSTSLLVEDIDESSSENLTDLPTRATIITPSIRLQLLAICRIVTVCAAVGSVILSLEFFVSNKILYLILIGVGSGFVFLSNPAMNMGVMLAVPKENRSLGVGMNIVFLHAFGDVPSPVFVGLLKDNLAPGCVSENGNEQNIAASQNCRNDSNGLRITMLFTSLWLLWNVFFFVWAFLLILSRNTSPLLTIPSDSSQNESERKLVAQIHSH